MITIILHGIFTQTHQKPLKFEAQTISQAIFGIVPQIKSLEILLSKIDAEVVHEGKVLSKEDLSQKFEGEVHLIPKVSGEKSGAFLEVLVGAAMIGAAFIPGVGAGFLFTALVSMGSGLVASGIASLLFPGPKMKSSDLNASTNSNSVNMAKAGVVKPIIFGKFRCNSNVVSALLTTS